MPSSLTRVLPIALVYSTRPPVSVMRYGHAGLARGFSRQRGIGHFGPSGTAIAPQDRAVDLPAAVISLQAWHRNPVTGWPTLLRHPIAQTTRRGTGLLTRCPSPTAFALGLGPTDPTPSTVASETSGISAGAFFTRLTLLVPAFALLRAPASLTGSPSLPAECSPTLVNARAAASVRGLDPPIFGAGPLDQ